MSYLALDKDQILTYLKSLKPELEKIGIVKIGLFGSYAKNKANIYSDIDVIIESSERFFHQLSACEVLSFYNELKAKISKHFKRRVDLMDIYKAKKDKIEILTKDTLYAYT